jgi:hypothetical protein
MRKLSVLGVLAAALLAGALMAGSTLAQTASCQLSDRSTDEVLPGVTLTWDSSFHCLNAPDTGTYEIDVTVSNAAGSDEAVRIRDVRLRQTTPRPRGRGPAATAEPAGLPVVVAPGETERFNVRARTSGLLATASRPCASTGRPRRTSSSSTSCSRDSTAWACCARSGLAGRRR